MPSKSTASLAQPLCQPSPARLTELSQAACDYVHRATSLDLDHTEESLAFVDHYLRQIGGQTRLRREVEELVAAALGVYVGELLVSRFGGRWLAIPTEPSKSPSEGTPLLDSLDDPAGWRVELAAAPLICDPVLWARQALQLGRDDSDDSDDSSVDSEPEGGGLVAPPNLMDRLLEAMARLPPVSEEYYYSMTGRFETVSYLVEILASLQQESRPDEPTENDRDNAANPQ